jgi:hypothetical protein
VDKKSLLTEYLKRPLPKSESEKKQSPEEMIRSLQGVFCKGRYRSWVATQENDSSAKERSTKKHRKSTLKE